MNIGDVSVTNGKFIVELKRIGDVPERDRTDQKVKALYFFIDPFSEIKQSSNRERTYNVMVNEHRFAYAYYQDGSLTHLQMTQDWLDDLDTEGVEEIYIEGFNNTPIKVKSDVATIPLKEKDINDILVTTREWLDSKNAAKSVPQNKSEKPSFFSNLKKKFF